MDKLLQIKNFNAGYEKNSVKTHAVRDVSFDIHKNEFIGIAGESGCGKSTLAFGITRLLNKPGKIFSGEVLFENNDLMKLNKKSLNKLRWKEFSIVYQASMNVLNPVKKIQDQFFDVMKAHTKWSKDQMTKRILELFKIVNISPEYLQAYPHQLSGGMKQRVVIAISLALNPKLIIMDEPTTALDVVVQRGILQEIDEIRKKLKFSVIFITHDLSLLVEMSDSIIIMYAGMIVEKAPSFDLYNNPFHPYTKGLMRSFPPLTGERQILHGINGTPPDLKQSISGCPFYERCDKRIENLCNKSNPVLKQIKKDHFIACHLFGGDHYE
ncbi:ABC transporter ATP-binding protein [Oceanotoga teriensis]|jgi:peptide/nickel transport system ATP-binding protein|uniref:Peptide/nickel transport system ATP-binding protein n=1 Tax=Oceanotoga teriensis TaxID=515440 RepID=A0AA45HIA0_9BACT|nr:ABC transporter ATP-binding protein [Oceanotoga teriensis]MDO7977390.1 ABC transporter ATP-binding protein [Oceanotoga teriensis]PWJ89659.1 peptide/nickel transport system ATP-binding protein [Oceanotoga teriensis]